MKTLKLLCTIAGICILSCVSGASGPGTGAGKDGRLLIWAHSDIQPRDGTELIHYEIAVDDTAKNIPGIDMAIVAGDIVHRRDSAHYYYQWFLETRSRAGIRYWFEIAGNHDANDYASYHNAVGKPLHYSVSIGNILFIFMSDEVRSAATDISDDVFRWWKDLVITNQDKILVTVTHGCLAGSGLLASINKTMTIKDSGRFERVLKKYPVDIWISAHSHLPHYLRGKSSQSYRFSRILFLDISAIRKDRWNTVESTFIKFENGTETVAITPRDHVSHEYLYGYGRNFSLRRPFRWDTSPPVLVPYAR